jgi:hypothetical protein
VKTPLVVSAVSAADTAAVLKGIGILALPLTFYDFIFVYFQSHIDRTIVYQHASGESTFDWTGG